MIRPTKARKLARGQIWRVNADNGEYANTYPGTASGLLAVSEIPAESLPKLPPIWQMFADPARRRSDGFGTNLIGLAADASCLYCSLHAENQVVVLDKRSGKRLRAIPVAEPAGLAMTPDGNLLVISGHKLLKYAPQGRLLSTVISQRLAVPYGLCVDAKGQITFPTRGRRCRSKSFAPRGS